MRSRMAPVTGSMSYSYSIWLTWKSTSYLVTPSSVSSSTLRREVSCSATPASSKAMRLAASSPV